MVILSLIIRINWWLAATPFAFVLWSYDEIRKWVMRAHPGGFIEREFYY